MNDKPWNEAFDLYLSRMQEHPLSVMLDLGAAPHAPLSTHPMLIRARVRMLRPREDGLRSSGEDKALESLEQRLVELVTTILTGLYVGRVEVNGLCDYIFYAPESPDASAEVVQDLLSRIAGDYELVTTIERDDEWNLYRDFLWPNPYEYQLMMNARQIELALAKGGDVDGDIAIEHLALFYREARARDAVSKLSAAGFEVDEPQRQSREGEPPEWSVAFRRSGRLRSTHVDGVVIDVLDIILPLEGRYDGWTVPASQQEN
jgi:hypothetical protein